MRELVLVLIILLFLMLFGAMAALPWSVIFTGGIATLVFGMVLGVPSGFVYHVKLRAELRKDGPPA